MKLKLDDAGHVVVSDGKPVYVTDDGKDIAFDYDSTIKTISRLNGEAKGNREEKEAFAKKLEAFEGLEPDAARKALDKVRALGDKELVESGEVDRLRKQMEEAFGERAKGIEAKYRPVVKERDDLASQLKNEVLGGAFARSKFINEKLAIPADMAKSAFGGRFDYENGQIVAKDPGGNRLLSRERPGEPAEFEEAIEMMVDGYAHRDSIMRGNNASGSGARGSGGGQGGGRSMSRAQFDSLPLGEQAKAAREMEITD